MMIRTDDPGQLGRLFAERANAGDLKGMLALFCSGDDITEMGSWGNANEIMRRVRGYQRMADTLADLDKITIAAVDGFAVGAVSRSQWRATS
ncbi:MAG TPA: hypothetical protein VHS55_05265 [Solirubrobacteraceae bacterium]|jgi:enoyl-CoA hydratase|nr:hypothetical protein [Solirubrobacteraceae bacterium]